MGLIELLTVAEAAEILKISRQQVRFLIADGSLYAVKVGREYRIPTESIRTFIYAPHEN